MKPSAVAVALLALSAVPRPNSAAPASAPAGADPVALVLSYHLGGSAHGLLVSGSTAYVAVGSRIVVFDISNPGNPTRQAELDLYPAEVSLAALDGTSLYLHYYGGDPVTSHARIAVVHASLPWRPRLKATLPFAARALAVSDGIAVAFDYGGVALYDVRQEGAASPLGSVPGDYWHAGSLQSYAVTLVGKTAFVGGARGVWTIDIRDPEAPQLQRISSSGRRRISPTWATVSMS